MHQAANSLLCRTGSLPLSYLGLPIGGNSSRLAWWEPILDWMKKKLSSWKGNLLSLGGRATLIKASLNSLPLYFISIFPIPIGIIDKIRQIQRQFFWNCNAGSKHLIPAAWRLLEVPKSLGGLGLGNIQHKNLGLLAKWLWRFICDPLPLWRGIISEKYKYGSLFSIRELQIPITCGPWRNLCNAIISHPQSKFLLKSSIRKRIDNGMDPLFWHDIWLGKVPLKLVSPRLFLLSNNKNAFVAANCFWDGLK